MYDGKLIVGAIMQDDKRYKAAKKRVNEIREFYTHLVVYVAVIAFLSVINVLITPGFPWVLIVMSGWGIGIVMHAWDAFGQYHLLGKDWEERKIAELLGEKSKRDNMTDEYFDEAQTK